MKLTIILLTVAFLQVSARGTAQTITYSGKNVSLEQVFSAIKKQTGYVFFYRNDDLARAHKVTISLKAATLQEALDRVFENQPLSYSIVDNTIVVKQKTPGAAIAVPLATGGIEDPDTLLTIRGRIINEMNEPVIASVQVKGTNKGTTTNDNGEFELKGVDDNATLVISGVSIESFEVKVNGRSELALSAKVRMVVGEEVTIEVNTGYQKIPKERATGAFAQPNKEMLNARVSTDVISKLEGITSGLVFNSPGVTGNNQPKLSIRGRSTIYANDNPLIVLDGFPYDGELSNLNPNDIDNITVLKDAAAASIWGVRAGNGVIIINSKKGRINQKLKISVNSNVMIGEKPDLFYDPNFLNSKDFISVEQVLFNNGYYDTQFTDPNSPPLSPVISILKKQQDGLISQQDATNEINSFLNRDVRNDLAGYFYSKSVNQQYSISLSGGTNKISHYFSAGYDRNQLSQKGNKFNRITLNSTNIYFPFRNFEVSSTINYIQSNTSRDNTLSQITTGGRYNTIYPYASLTDPSGNPAFIIKDYSLSYQDWAETKGYLNGKFIPLQELENGWNTSGINNNDLRLNTSIKYDILKGLTAEAKYQYERAVTQSNTLATEQSYYSRYFVNRYSQTNADSAVTGYNIPVGGILSNSNNNLYSHHFRTQLNYSNTWHVHELVALAGFEASEVRNNNSSNTLYGYNDELGTSQPVDNVTGFQLNPTGNGTISSGESVGGILDRFRSYFANAAYTYNNRYTLSASGRIDGSNYFGVEANQKNVPLWSIGGRWVIDKEKFFKPGWFSNLALRASYGYNGNLDKNLAAVITLYYPGFTGPFTNANFARVSNVGNPELRWEKIGITNFGLDFTIKNSILSGSLEYYFKRGIDIIGFSSFAPSTGISNLEGNYAAIKGEGVDVQLNSRNIFKKLKWTSSFLFSWSTDLVSKYTGSNIQPSGLIGAGQIISPVEGRPVYGIYSYRWAGLDPITGDPQGYDASKNISKNYSDLVNPTSIEEFVYNGPARPVVHGGLLNRISFKNVSMAFNISYKMGYYFNRSGLNYSRLFSSWSGHKDFSKRWMVSGDENNTSVPSFIYPSDPNRDRFYQYSEILIEKGDHIRLQDFSLSYDLVNLFTKSLGMNRVQFYFYANNIGIIWRANDLKLDPDFPYGGIPTPRTYAFGIKADF